MFLSLHRLGKKNIFPPTVFCRIEKKRTIIPAMLEALQNCKSSEINLSYFYSLLFTRENLRLVHIVCHKKGSHNLQCDTKKIFQNTREKAKGRKRRLK